VKIKSQFFLKKIYKKSQIQFIPNTNICYFENMYKDNFDELAKTNIGLYIMKKWCSKDVDMFVNNFLKKAKTILLWIKAKNYVINKVHNKLINSKINNMLAFFRNNKEATLLKKTERKY